MQSITLLILPLFLILLSSAIVPYSFASVESEAQEDIEAGCRADETLVYRLTYKDYVCVEPSTAERWQELGLAEIVTPSTEDSVKETPEIEPDVSEFSGAPPEAPKQTRTTSDDSECRAGYTLVYRLIHHDEFCTSPSTAERWQELGLAEIITAGVIIETSPSDEEVIVDDSDEFPSERDVDEDSDDKVNDEDQKQVPDEPKPQSKPIDSTNISMPAYPNQPSVHPSLDEANDFWSPPKVHQINDRIWVAVGYDAANSIMIEGETGIIIVDTLSTYESAKKVLNEFRKITDKPVKAIVYTHGHLDHVQGTKAFLEEGDGSVEIIAHESLLDFYINENSVLGPIASVRSSFASGSLLPDDGPDATNLGVFPKMQPGTIAFVPPTHTFSDEFSLDISGVKMNLVHVAGESPDQIYAWLPEDETLLIGDNAYSIFPNIYTLRGSVYRDPMNYVNAFDKMILLEPQHLVSSHVKPVSGQDNVLNVLISTRDATQFIYDQTIRGMNNGYTADELSYMVELPQWFEEFPWLSQSRGQIPWHVKQIYFGNLGWYQGDPAFLLPISDDQRAHKFVEGVGGVEKAIQEIRNAIDNGEYNWAAELATYVIAVDPENDEAKLLKAHSLRVIGQRMLSADGRHWALTSALESEGKIIVDSNTFTQTSPEQLAELPIEKILKSLSSKVDPEKTDDSEYIIHVVYSDTDQKFTLHFRNGILAVNSGHNFYEDNTITLDTDTHKLLIVGELDLIDSIESGKISFDGDLDDLETWLGYLEPVRSKVT